MDVTATDAWERGAKYNGTRIYTPYPEYEESVPPSGPTTQRSSYFLAGQLMAVRVRTGTSGDVAE